MLGFTVHEIDVSTISQNVGNSIYSTCWEEPLVVFRIFGWKPIANFFTYQPGGKLCEGQIVCGFTSFPQILVWILPAGMCTDASQVPQFPWDFWFFRRHFYPLIKGCIQNKCELLQCWSTENASKVMSPRWNAFKRNTESAAHWLNLEPGKFKP